MTKRLLHRAPRAALWAILWGAATMLVAARAEAREPSPTALRRAIDAVVDRPAFLPALWGIEVRSLSSGRVLYARNAEKNLRPASTLKLVTTAAALDLLGPDARLRTTLETAGDVDAEGRLLGDLYLVGRGDPSLSGRFAGGRETAPLEELADALWRSGIRRVEGRLIGQEGYFTGERRGEDWSWGDLVWSYGAEVSALCFNEGAVDLELRGGERVGDAARVESRPASDYYQVISRVMTSSRGSEPELTLERDLGTNQIRLTGSYPLGATAWTGSVALEDPARYAASVLGEVLRRRGIAIAGEVTTSSLPMPADARVLAEHTSPPLLEILEVTNKESQNLYAETLLRLIGARASGQGSREAGLAAVAAFLSRMGVHAESWSLQDGSGLSRSDLLSAHELANLLVAMDRHAQAAAFRRTLAVAGVDGTLERRLRGPLARGRVAAKTGTLRHVNALAGYVNTRSGERLALVAIVNNHTAGSPAAIAAIDAIVRTLAGS